MAGIICDVVKRRCWILAKVNSVNQDDGKTYEHGTRNLKFSGVLDRDPRHHLQRLFRQAKSSPAYHLNAIGNVFQIKGNLTNAAAVRQLDAMNMRRR